MFCSRCGSAIPAGGVFCPSCGTATTTTPTAPSASVTLERPGLVTVLAVLQFIGAAFSMLVAIGLLVAPFSADGDDATGGFALFVGLLFGAAGVGQLFCGIGLLKLQPYGRTLQMVFASIGLLGIPIGTILGILILIYMSKPGIKALFSGKDAADLTPEEVTAVCAVGSGSAAMVVAIVLVVVFGGVMTLGIIAAIAIPGLLRARMAGNEASAIGSLRAITSAEASYSSSAGKGGYATSLAVLAAPCPGSSQGFITPDLGQDPSVRSGYVVALESAGAAKGEDDCNGKPTELDFYATAVPTTIGTTGTRAFSSSGASTIYVDARGSAPSLDDIRRGTATPIQ